MDVCTVCVFVRTPCTQKRDSDLPNYGKKVPLPGEVVCENEDDPVRTDLLAQALLGPDLAPSAQSDLILIHRDDGEVLHVDPIVPLVGGEGSKSLNTPTSNLHHPPADTPAGTQGTLTDTDRSAADGTADLTDNIQELSVDDYFKSCQVGGCMTAQGVQVAHDWSGYCIGGISVSAAHSVV